MKENKKENSHKGEDLNFIPLNIKDQLKFNNANIAPSITPDGLSINNGTNYIFVGFPPVNLATSQLPNVSAPATKAPLMPYPMNVPAVNNSPIINDNSTNTKSKNTPGTENKSYPYNNTTQNTDTQKTTDLNNNYQYNNNPNNTIDLQYPSETDDETLYSYNKQSQTRNQSLDIVNPVDILRELALFEEDDIKNNYRESKGSDVVDDIFNKIQVEHDAVFAMLKAHRMPFPLAKLLIKKIIRITLLYKK